jgi:hypothetical protein
MQTNRLAFSFVQTNSMRLIVVFFYLEFIKFVLFISLFSLAQLFFEWETPENLYWLRYTETR